MAIARASSDYVVQVDGDMVLHPEFIADHRRAATPGHWVQGTRILLDQERSKDVMARGPKTFGPFAAGLGLKRRPYALRLPRVSAGLRTAANAVVAVKGCNQGFWRADLERINGYNEDMIGWGFEDKELAARLRHAGIRRATLLFGGIAYHLHHAPASRERHGTNETILAQTLERRLVRCPHGLNLHRSQPTQGAVI